MCDFAYLTIVDNKIKSELYVLCEKRTIKKILASNKVIYILSSRIIDTIIIQE